MGKVFYLKNYTPLNPLSRGEMFICLTPSVWMFILAWPKTNQKPKKNLTQSVRQRTLPLNR